MAFKIRGCDNIRESFTIITATAVVPLGGAVPESRPFSAKLANGDTSWIGLRKGAEISVGEYTYNTGSPNTITQTGPKYTSNGDAAVTFSPGAGGEAYIDLPSFVLALLNLTETTLVSAATFDLGSRDALRIASSGTTGPVTSLGTAVDQLKLVRWSGQTVNHNATSLILIGAANWVTVANDMSLLVSDGSGNWREAFRRYADGRIVSHGLLDISGAAAGQIKFPATQNPSADANTLDDYEEGSWTPGVTFGGGSTGVTYNVRGATYVKIGRKVFCQGYMLLSSKGSSTGFAAITGLPFTATGTANSHTSSSCRVSGMNTTGPYFVQINVGASSMEVNVQNLGDATAVTDTAFKNTAEFVFGFLYEAAA